MADYWTLDGFEDVYLEDSWIISIDQTPSGLTIGGEFVLRESHQGYSDPLPGEQYCYRRGVIRFTEVTSLVWADRGRPPAVDASGEPDLGSFDAFLTDRDAFVLEGDFGRIRVTASQVDLELEVREDCIES